MGLFKLFPSSVIKNSIKTETVLLRHLNPPSNDYESVYLQLLRFSLYISRSSLRLPYTILVYLSYFPLTIGCENRTLICIFRDMYSDILVANIKLFRV